MQCILETVCANQSINSAFTNTKQHVWSGLVQQIGALNNNVETLEAIYANGKLIGSGCALQLVKQSAIFYILKLSNYELVHTYLRLGIFQSPALWFDQHQALGCTSALYGA